MLNKIIPVLLAGCILLGWGCKRQSDEPPADANSGSVKTEIKEAVDASGDYLKRQKDAIVEKTSEIYSQLDKDTRQLLTDIKESGRETWQKSSVELDAKLAVAKQKFDELKDAGGDNVQKAQDAFNVAIDELKDAYGKTKAEMTKEDDK